MKQLGNGIGFIACALIVNFASADELKLSHFMSPNHPFHGMIFESWAKDVSEVTNGEVTVEIYPAGELGQGPAEQYSRTIDGVSDISFIVQGYTAGNVFPLTLIAEQPGAIRDLQDTTGAMNRATDLFADEYRRVKLLATWAMPPAVLFTRTKDVRSLADMDGMKVRAPTREGGALIEAWGGTPIFMPATEVYTAMQTGVVDAVLINASAAAAFKLSEVATYMISGFDSLPPVFGLIMNRGAYDGLSDNARNSFDEVTVGTLASHAGEISNRITDFGMKSFLERDGNQHVELTQEQAAPFNEAAARILASRIKELETQGLPAAAVLAAMRGE